MADETIKQKDALPEKGQPSEAEKGTEPKPPRTYTEAEWQKAISNHKAELGRVAKKASLAEESANLASKEAKEVREKLVELERQRELVELESVRGDPDLLRAYRDKIEMREEKERVARGKVELERDKLQHKETIEAMQRFHRERTAEQVASEKGVNVKLLLRSGANTQEEMEEFAEEIKASLPKVEGATPPVRPDAGITSGVSKGKTPSLEELKASSPGETAQKVKSGEWILPGWK